MEPELLDTRTWRTPAELASAIFEWIEGWYDPRRLHTSIDDLSPVEYEGRLTARRGGRISIRELSGKPGQAPLAAGSEGCGLLGHEASREAWATLHSGYDAGSTSPGPCLHPLASPVRGHWAAASTSDHIGRRISSTHSAPIAAAAA